jgi:hypothetical protein
MEISRAGESLADELGADDFPVADEKRAVGLGREQDLR